MAISSVSEERENSTPPEPRHPTSGDGYRGITADTRASEALEGAFLRRAAPGGIPDERFLADPGEFAELVRRDVKGEIPGREGSREGAALGSYLREPGVAGRWGSILRQIEADVERQLARRQGPTEGWRGAAERFLIHVRRRLAEARRIAGAPEEALVRPGVEPWSADEAGTYERLTVVRRYLVEESRLPEPERGERREHAISALSEVMAGAASHGRAVR